MSDHRQDIEAQRGDDEEYELRVTVSPGGAPKDLSGAQLLTFTARHGVNGPVVLERTLGNGVTITDGPGGVATITLAPADTLPLPNRRIALVYDVELRDSVGRTSTPVRGRLVIRPDVTAQQ